MKVGSLFSGIGGLDLGLERAGMRIVWQVEIDEFCRRVLAKHWPDVSRYEDVRDVGAKELAPVDLIAGGFPCQEISVAGPRTGLAGRNSSLWLEFYRIICELRPRFALMENTPSLTVRGLDTILGALASIGYDAEWDCLPAAAFGAPHLRARTWILAYPSGLRNETNDTVFAGRTLAELRARWPTEAGIRRVDDGPPYSLDSAQRLRAIGNAVVPQIGEWIGRRIMEVVVQIKEEA